MIKVKLTANVLFSGVGMQERGINNSGLFDLEIISTSEIDKYAILSYAAVHNGLTTEQLEQEYSKHQTEIEDKRDYMIKWLTAKKIGFDFVKNKMPNWDRCIDYLWEWFRHQCREVSDKGVSEPFWGDPNENLPKGSMLR